MVWLGGVVSFIGLQHKRGMIMKNSLKLSILVCASILISGCAGIRGRWESTGKIRPADAVGEFSVGDATFNYDGTYEATMSYGGNERKSTGTYTYAWNNLTLTPDGGGSAREYDVKIALIGGTMDIEYEREDERDIHVEMKRAGCAKDCDKKCCKPS